MDEGAGGGDTDMGMLPMLGFETQHRTASGGAERSHLPLLDPAVVTKSCPGTAHCHEWPFSAVRLNTTISLNQ